MQLIQLELSGRSAFRSIEYSLQTGAQQTLSVDALLSFEDEIELVKPDGSRFTFSGPLRLSITKCSRMMATKRWHRLKHQLDKVEGNLLGTVASKETPEEIAETKSSILRDMCIGSMDYTRDSIWTRLEVSSSVFSALWKDLTSHRPVRVSLSVSGLKGRDPWDVRSSPELGIWDATFFTRPRPRRLRPKRRGKTDPTRPASISAVPTAEPSSDGLLSKLLGRRG
jgi:hypothetical protein